jgi:hypothetical protein
MTRTSILFALVFTACLSGCVQSLHPFYTEAQLTYDPSLVGTWAPPEEGERLVITGDAENKTYEAVYTDNEKKTGKFEVRLAKVQDQLLLDITPQEMWRDDQAETHAVHLLPVHSFMIVEMKADNSDELILRQMDYDWLKGYLEKNPSAVAHETLNGDRIILTAPTEKVQAFVVEHIKTPDAYEEPQTLKRVKAPATAPAGADKP